MTFEDLIRELGAKLGTELTPEDGICTLGVDDMVVTLMNLPEVESIALSGEIGEPPPQGLTELYRSMLMANHLFSGTAGSTISLDEASGKFHLCRLDQLALADSEGYFALLERFVNTLETWRKMLADYRPIDTQLQPQAGDGLDVQALGAAYMSV